MSLSTTFADRCSRLGISIPEILVPRQGVSHETWAVVACDQYTSDQDYWNRVARHCEGKKSTLHITLPEIYLKSPDLKERIGKVQDTMATYLSDSTLESVGEGLVYIERRTQSGLRQGLLVAMDLECYDYSPDSTTLTRATEGTIVDRIPPRLAVREKALVELPHIMVLIDDPALDIIEGLAHLSTGAPLYNVDLMEHGGKLKGWLIKDEAKCAGILDKLEALKARIMKQQGTDTPLLFAMGDGNHSLATAKASWEAIKKELRAKGTPEAVVLAHPARHALAELVNIHSPGLRFEPIHRTIFTSRPADFIKVLKNGKGLESLVPAEEAQIKEHLEHSADGQRCFGLFDGTSWFLGTLGTDCTELPPRFADMAYEAFAPSDGHADIDFIHGWKDCTRLAGTKAVSLLMPVIARDKLFSRVEKFGPLPRKAFSMGEAEEKRYYFEARKIRN